MSKRGKRGSWAGGKAPAQGSAGTKEKDSSGIASAFGAGSCGTSCCCGEGCPCGNGGGFAPGFKRP